MAFKSLTLRLVRSRFHVHRCHLKMTGYKIWERIKAFKPHKLDIWNYSSTVPPEIWESHMMQHMWQHYTHICIWRTGEPLLILSVSSIRPALISGYRSDRRVRLFICSPGSRRPATCDAPPSHPESMQIFKACKLQHINFKMHFPWRAPLAYLAISIWVQGCQDEREYWAGVLWANWHGKTPISLEVQVASRVYRTIQVQ